MLGCRVWPVGRLSEAAARRVARAARAFREQPCVLVVSGGRRWQGECEADAMADALVELGVPAGGILRERCSLSTCENAYYVAELLGRGRRVGVVSCDWHLPRALLSFRRAGLEPSPLPAPSPALPPLRRLRRSARERASFWLDEVAT
ncbi:MAG TPA: YdcF family protein, partial [Polyangiaceae bacterium]|nr:YdcF family protein [Polyangiaceae bacterium]